MAVYPVARWAGGRRSSRRRRSGRLPERHSAAQDESSYSSAELQVHNTSAAWVIGMDGQLASPDQRRGGVIFDVGGTLPDTNYQHAAAWWEAFGGRGLDVSCADIHRASGMGSAELVERVVGEPDPSVSEAHSRHFVPYFGRMRPLPGAAGLIEATARLGLNVVLATSAKDDEVGLMLAHWAPTRRSALSSARARSSGPSPARALSNGLWASQVPTGRMLSWSAIRSGM
jgi:hypothetical protein